MYKHILIATDGSEIAQKGLAHGLALAKNLNATTSVVVVSEVLTGAVLAGDAEIGIFTAVAELRKASEAAAQRILTAAGAEAKRVGVPCELVHVSNVAPAEGILDTAKQRNCDLIVLASHGRRGIEKLLLGSQAAEVVARATGPVLVVR